MFIPLTQVYELIAKDDDGNITAITSRCVVPVACIGFIEEVKPETTGEHNRFAGHGAQTEIELKSNSGVDTIFVSESIADVWAALQNCNIR